MLPSEDRVDKEIEAEKEKAASLKAQIAIWERKVAEQRAAGLTTRCSMKSETSKIHKRTSIVEDKLHREQIRFNKLMNRNGELREELETLQLQRKNFLHVRSKLEKELHAIQKEIGSLKTKCTKASNASAKIQEKLRMLRDQDAKDAAQFVKEKSKLEQELSPHCYIEAFLDRKANVRSRQDIKSRGVKRNKQVKSKEMELDEFEDALLQILKETGDSNVDKVIKNFIEMEEQNYTLLNIVNYQHKEADAIRRQIAQLCIEREIFVAEKQQQKEQHEALQMRAAIKLEASKQQLAAYQHRIEFMETLLDQSREGVKSLLQTSFGSSIYEHSGSSEQVMDENIKEHLRMVEDRVNKLLAMLSYTHPQENLTSWDNDSLSAIAGQLHGIPPSAVGGNTAASTPAPENDPDLVESVLLEAKEPVNRENLLTLVNKKDSEEKEGRLT